GPIDEHGNPTERYRLVSEVGRFLDRHGPDLLEAREIHDPVGFGIYYPNFRFNADDYFAETDRIDPHRYLAFLAQAGLYALLLSAGVNPRVVDLDQLDAKPLAELQVLLWTTKGY